MMKNYKKLIFKERRYSFRHVREVKEEKIIYVPYEVSNPGHNSGGTRGKARGGLEPPTPRAYYNSTDVFFSHGGGEGLRKGGTSRRKLRSNFWTPD